LPSFLGLSKKKEFEKKIYFNADMSSKRKTVIILFKFQGPCGTNIFIDKDALLPSQNLMHDIHVHNS